MVLRYIWTVWMTRVHSPRGTHACRLCAREVKSTRVNSALLDAREASTRVGVHPNWAVA